MEIKLKSTLKKKAVLKRLTNKNGEASKTFILKTDYPTTNIRVSRVDGKIRFIDPVGGPRISLDKTIKNIDESFVVREIVYNSKLNNYIITFYNNDFLD